jgi:hypothetical protein
MVVALPAPGCWMLLGRYSHPTNAFTGLAASILAMRRSRYTLGTMWSPAVLGGFVLFAAVSVFLLLPGDTHGAKPPWPFVVFWVFAWGWNAYWWLFRVSYRLEIEGHVLRWATPVLHGEAEISDVSHIGPSAFSRQLSVIKLSTGKTLMTMTRPGFTDFATELMQGARLATFTLNGYEQRQSKLSLRRSAFTKLD